MTQREFYTAVMNGDITEEVKAFAEKAITKLDTKNSNRKPTKKQEENQEIMTKIVEYISGTENGAFISEIATALEITIQKAGALCVQLTNKGELVRTEVKVKNKGKLKKYLIAE